ncbi:MAG: DUF1002 domain-containing protein [Lachnospiraceae bacterium]|nr:DUF1002 domain-containing protein [Lachnospiraceae bacterium]
MKMKKLISLILAGTMTLSMCSAVFATEVITFDNTSTETVSGNAVSDTNATGDQAQTNAEKKKEGVNYEKAYLALGKDLTPDQLNTVLSLMGIPASDLEKYEVVYITNADEHANLDSYIDPKVIGSRALSSVLVRPAAKGYGVVVTTKNISYCTTNMYRNALITAGVEDADIMVVGPSQISGTAALIGALKAYENMSGETVTQAAMDTALNELVTTGELSTTVGSNTEAEELISYVKAQIAANDLNTEEEIDAVIRQGMKDYNVTLSEDDIKDITELMMKIKGMGIDFNVLADQAEDIYAKYKDKIDAGTFTIQDVKIEDLGLGKIVSSATNNFFKNAVDSISKFFSGLFSFTKKK